MTDQELEALLDDMESDRIERTGAFSDGDKLRQAICAFANDLPGHGKPGVLCVGVDDNGMVLVRADGQAARKRNQSQHLSRGRLEPQVFGIAGQSRDADAENQTDDAEHDQQLHQRHATCGVRSAACGTKRPSVIPQSAFRNPHSLWHVTSYRCRRRCRRHLRHLDPLRADQRSARGAWARRHSRKCTDTVAPRDPATPHP